MREKVLRIRIATFLASDLRGVRNSTREEGSCPNMRLKMKIKAARRQYLVLQPAREGQIVRRQTYHIASSSKVPRCEAEGEQMRELLEV